MINYLHNNNIILYYIWSFVVSIYAKNINSFHFRRIIRQSVTSIHWIRRLK